MFVGSPRKPTRWFSSPANTTCGIAFPERTATPKFATGLVDVYEVDALGPGVGGVARGRVAVAIDLLAARRRSSRR